MISQVISIYGSDAVIYGYENDHYFQHANIHAANNPILQRTLERLPPGSVIIDGGANIGVMSVTASRAAPAVKRIIAIEPSAKALPCLRATVAANAIDPLTTIVPRGLSDKDETLALAEYDGHIAASHVLADPRAADPLARDPVRVIKIQLTTLDKIVADLQLDQLDLVKLDIEGFEPEALKGARRTIDRFRPTFVIEFCGLNLCVQRRTSPVFLIEQVRDGFGSFEYMKKDGSLVQVATDRDAYEFLRYNLQESIVDDIRFGGS